MILNSTIRKKISKNGKKIFQKSDLYRILDINSIPGETMSAQYPHDSYLQRLESIMDKIGHTPLLEISFTYHSKPMRIFAKTEHSNFSGSVKDRMVANILKEAYLRSKQPAATPVSRWLLSDRHLVTRLPSLCLTGSPKSGSI